MHEARLTDSEKAWIEQNVKDPKLRALLGRGPGSLRVYTLELVADFHSRRLKWLGDQIDAAPDKHWDLYAPVLTKGVREVREDGERLKACASEILAGIAAENAEYDKRWKRATREIPPRADNYRKLIDVEIPWWRERAIMAGARAEDLWDDDHPFEWIRRVEPCVFGMLKVRHLQAKAAGGRKSFDEVRAYLLKYSKRHGYTSIRSLAKEVDCGPPLIDRVIKASPALRAWMKSKIKEVRARTMNEGDESDENVKVEPADVNILTDAECQRALDDLIYDLPEQEQEAARNRLNEMSEGERQSLATCHVDNKPTEKKVRHGTKLLGTKLLGRKA